MYALQAPYFQKILEKEAKGTAQKGVYLGALKLLPIPLPPINEQQRIVAKIEELFSELEQAEKTLTITQKKLDLYNHVILNDAFQGKLTPKAKVFFIG